MLLATGADPDAQNDSQMTPLHCAVFGSRPDNLDNLEEGNDAITRRLAIIEALLDVGADDDITNASGDTPLQYAVLLNNKSAARLLRGIRPVQDTEPDLQGRPWSKWRAYFSVGDDLPE